MSPALYYTLPVLCLLVLAGCWVSYRNANKKEKEFYKSVTVKTNVVIIFSGLHLIAGIPYIVIFIASGHIIWLYAGVYSFFGGVFFYGLGKIYQHTQLTSMLAQLSYTNMLKQNQQATQTPSTYRIVFKGELLSNTNSQIQSQFLQKIMSISKISYEEILSPKPKVLKSNLTLSQAVEMNNKLSRAGILTDIVEQKS